MFVLKTSKKFTCNTCCQIRLKPLLPTLFRRGRGGGDIAKRFLTFSPDFFRVTGGEGKTCTVSQLADFACGSHTPLVSILSPSCLFLCMLSLYFFLFLPFLDITLCIFRLSPSTLFLYFFSLFTLRIIHLPFVSLVSANNMLLYLVFFVIFVLFSVTMSFSFCASK
jgi:hypothetical protein